MFICPKLSLKRVPSELYVDSDFKSQVCASRSDELARLHDPQSLAPRTSIAFGDPVASYSLSVGLCAGLLLG